MLSLLAASSCYCAHVRHAPQGNISPRRQGRACVLLHEASELPKTGGYVKFCDEDTMAPKAHGTSASPVQANLRWNCDRKVADRICNFNRHAAEYRGYYKAETRFLANVCRDEPTVYYDSVTGVPLFVAPIGRSMDEFLSESDTHGWPSFRDDEVG